MAEQLHQTIEALHESEERFRDLFDEAPMAYVQEDADTRLIRANKAAMKILGIEPHEVAGTFGKSFVPKSLARRCSSREKVALAKNLLPAPFMNTAREKTVRSSK